jgi:hypothetical protein
MPNAIESSCITSRSERYYKGGDQTRGG